MNAVTRKERGSMHATGSLSSNAWVQKLWRETVRTISVQCGSFQNVITATLVARIKTGRTEWLRTAVR